MNSSRRKTCLEWQGTGRAPTNLDLLFLRYPFLRAAVLFLLAFGVLTLLGVVLR